MTSKLITLASRPAAPIAVIRRQVAPDRLGAAVQEACGAVWAELRAQGLRGERNIALYRDDRVELEAGVEFDGTFLERSGVVRSATPAGLVASLTHRGAYHTLAAAHAALNEWCLLTGHRTLGPRWEIYGHWRPEWNADPSMIETEVAYLVAPA